MSLHRVFLFLLTAIPSLSFAAPPDWSHIVKNGGLRVEDKGGRPLVSYRASEAFIPASTMKIPMSFCALEALGREYRFVTDFYLSTTPQGEMTLAIKGSGDPWLVSEELHRIASQLAKGAKRIDRISVDPSFFANPITIDGASASTNPYDAKNAAFVGNFSTAFLTRRRDGSIISAEPQTPLTPIAEAAGLRLPRGVTERVNLGSDWKTGARYGAELLAALLTKAGVKGAKEVSLEDAPSDAEPVYRHVSSQSLEELVRGLLQYSTNFTSNQLFLAVGAAKYGAPATVEKGQRALKKCLVEEVGWSDFHVEEGSGLSRKTRISPVQMTSLLQRFAKYKDLLHVQDGFTAKTGTLTGVNALAGYFSLPDRGEVRFALFVNDSVPANYKYTAASEVRKYLLGVR
jgi:D-alanyl-D-alanine carboxypeptidase/D-alanyl-D-alanine-endopeptidase (penicillin-binding protein 4)